MKTVWLANVKVKISDPSRTLVDMFMFPDFCGGLRFLVDVLKNYLSSDMKNIDQLIQYLDKSQNGAALKRLGFILESNFPAEQRLIEYCAKNLTSGYAKLIPNVSCEKLITRWRIWIPGLWKAGVV